MASLGLSLSRVEKLVGQPRPLVAPVAFGVRGADSPNPSRYLSQESGYHTLHWVKCHLFRQHEYGVRCEPARVFLRCHFCGRQTGGWQVEVRPLRPLPARARVAVAPAPVVTPLVAPSILAFPPPQGLVARARPHVRRAHARRQEPWVRVVINVHEGLAARVLGYYATTLTHASRDPPALLAAA